MARTLCAMPDEATLHVDYAFSRWGMTRAVLAAACLVCPAYGRRQVDLRLGRLRPIPPHEPFQRKPERDHDQAEDDDRQHREGEVAPILRRVDYLVPAVVAASRLR